jgi:hypothetical protein
MNDSVETETRIDINCLSEPERQLFNRIDEIIEEYKPANPPADVIEKDADLWNKGLEIFGRRTMELFVEVMPASLCCDELEEWYFKIYFYNFWLDWLEPDWVFCTDTMVFDRKKGSGRPLNSRFIGAALPCGRCFGSITI